MRIEVCAQIDLDDRYVIEIYGYSSDSWYAPPVLDEMIVFSSAHAET